MAQLTPEQQQQFMQALASDQGLASNQGGVPVEDNAGASLTPEQQQQAMQQGADMAAADAGGQPVDVGTPPVPEGADANAQLLQQLGFGSLEEMANAYKELSRASSETKEMLSQLTAIQKSMENADGLDPADPNYRVKSAIRQELKPLYDKLRADAHNRLIQDKWAESAKGKPDLAQHMPDISVFLKEHPDLSVAEDGLDRAYDAVRSRKYRSEADMLADPDFLKRISENDKVKQMVLERHLQDVARNGDVPQTISSGGNVPLSEKKGMNTLAHAKQALASKLGLK